MLSIQIVHYPLRYISEASRILTTTGFVDSNIFTVELYPLCFMLMPGSEVRARTLETNYLIDHNFTRQAIVTAFQTKETGFQLLGKLSETH